MYSINKDIAINLAILLCTVVVMFVGIEVALRMFMPQLATTSTSLQFDDELGSVPIPNLEGQAISPTREFNIKYSVNSKGYRGEEHIHNASKNRIVILGDSFTFGVNVEDGDTVAEVLEDSLVNTDVVNLGVPGYGTAQAYLRFKKEGLQYEPNVTILFFFSNDVADNLRVGHVPAFDRNLILVHKPEKSKSAGFKLRNYLHERSHLYHFVADRVHSIRPIENIFIKAGLMQFPYPSISEIEMFKKEYTPEFVEGWEVTKRLIIEIKDISEDNNSTFILVLIPDKNQCSTDEWAQFLYNLRVDGNNYDINRAGHLFAEFSEEYDIIFIDLLPHFINNNCSELYYKSDGHWNPKGNKFVSEVILNELKIGEIKPGA